MTERAIEIDRICAGEEKHYAIYNLPLHIYGP